MIIMQNKLTVIGLELQTIIYLLLKYASSPVTAVAKILATKFYPLDEEPVALCVDKCFKIYHNQKDYINYLHKTD